METNERKLKPMRIAIYGAGKCGEYVLREIQSHQESKVEINLLCAAKLRCCDFAGYPSGHGVPPLNE